jgi:hypothetical protein
MVPGGRVGGCVWEAMAERGVAVGEGLKKVVGGCRVAKERHAKMQAGDRIPGDRKGTGKLQGWRRGGGKGTVEMPAVQGSPP